MSEKDKNQLPEENPQDKHDDGQSGKKDRKHHLIKNAWLRIPLKFIMWVVIVVLLIPVLLYVPPVQTFVKNVACNVVRKSTGMDISIDRFRLKWPLDVSLNGVTIIEASGDTMVYAREVVADVKMLPLLKLNVDVNKLQLNDGYYRMLSPDSSMLLKIKAGFLEVDDRSSVSIATSEINLNKALIKDGNLSLVMDVWKQKPAPSDSTAVPFVIRANDLVLDNFTFGMSMLPTIDTLNLQTSRLQLRKGVVDLGKNEITADYLATADGNVTYLTPTPEYIASHPAPVTPDSLSQQSAPMVIKGDTVMLSGFKALYAVKDAKPLEGFDPSYIEVSDVAVTLDDFYNASSTIELPIEKIEAKERSGLRIMEGHGLVAIDSTGLTLKGLTVKTPYSNLYATAGIPFALMQLEPKAPVNVEASGSVGMPDVEAFMPALKPYTTKLPQRNPLVFNLKAEGLLSRVDIPELKLSMPGVFGLAASGEAANALDIKKLDANLDFEGNVSNPQVVGKLLGDIGFRVPTLKLKGEASAHAQTYAARFSLLTSAGDLAAQGKVSMNAETYGADLKVKGVDVGYFMPDLGIGKVTAVVEAKGAGFNPTKPNAETDILARIQSIVYNKKELRDITAEVSLADGIYSLNAVSNNPGAEISIDGHGTIAPDLYTFDVEGVLARVDLKELGVTEEANGGNGRISLKGSASPDKWLYDADLSIDSLEWTLGTQYLAVPGPLTASFKSVGDKVTADVSAKQTTAEFVAHTGLQDLVKRFTEVADSVSHQIKERNLDVEGLQRTLPSFTLDLNASGHGILGEYLRTMGMDVDTVYASFENDSLIHARMGAFELGNKSMRADTLTLRLVQRGKLLDYFAHMGNRSNNPIAEFANVEVMGYVGSNRLLLSMMQKNQKQEMGYRLGLTAAVADSVATVHFTPLKATIAYLPWQFNDDNHIDVNLRNFRINANLQASSNESSILMKTESGSNGNDELHLALDNIHIQDFLKMSVFAPPVTASVDADLRVGYLNNWLYGGGTMSVNDFTYDKLRVGDFDLGIKAGRNDDGTSAARLALQIDKHEALVAKAVLSPDSVGAMIPKKMGVELTRFPVSIANPFIGTDVARLSGYLNGALDLNGSFSAPLLNGHIACDSLSVYVPMIGSSLKFGQDSIKMADNVLSLDNFDIIGANENPLVLNGSVDASKLSSILFNLQANAKNFQLIGNDKSAKSEIYGKVFLDMNASATGPMTHVNLNANVDVLSATDVTYSVSQTQAQLQQQDASGVVKFVNFNDTAKVAVVDSITPAMAIRIVAGLSIQPGAKIKVDIPSSITNAASGSGKVELSPSGTLNYFQNYMGDMRLNGQLTLGNGFAQYSLPVVGQKKFVFNPESSVQWNGDLMNPTLRITATDDIKANLLENGNSRMVNFLVKLSISNTLSSPKVVFDLSTEDDMTVENELMSMSTDQRSMAAINLLLTGQYTGEGVKTASSDMMQGALYNALTSQLNSWMANHVKGVDLSFGVDQYNKTVNGETGSAMSYSYTMSKSLFNNKFKISVGGNYSTDASADENFSENLISDISFEYILRQTTNTTMYLRLFRHTGYESILEGEITETGVGFVMKRRLASLRNLFRLSTWRPRPPEEGSDSIPQKEPISPFGPVGLPNTLAPAPLQKDSIK